MNDHVSLVVDDELDFPEVPFDHTPTRAARPDVLGEVVFLSEWQKLMASDADNAEQLVGANGCLSSILFEHPCRLNQRHATVAASLVKWFGTNCGLAFLIKGRQVADKWDSSFLGPAWVSAWAVWNLREPWRNDGVRTIEAILAEPEDFTPRGGLRPPKLSAEDYETVEAVVYWLGSREGSEFIARCEAEIERRLNNLRRSKNGVAPAETVRKGKWHQLSGSVQGEELRVGGLLLACWQEDPVVAYGDLGRIKTVLFVPGERTSCGRFEHAAEAREAIEHSVNGMLIALTG